MDSPEEEETLQNHEDEEEEEEEEEEEKVGRRRISDVIIIVLRVIIGIVVPIAGMCLVSIIIGMIGVFMASSLPLTTPPISFPSHCTILSSSVDLRSSKVCELGLLNYKAKHVFYPFDSSKFRCRYDYYWASVFQVEYKDHSLGQTRLAYTEAPSEALPLNCRPDFGAAWLTKHIFKVNQTYDCWYSVGISKVSLYRDGLFPCQVQKPSLSEMLRHYVILSIKTLRSFFVHKKGNTTQWRWETVAGVVTGFSTSLISISFIGVLHHVKSRFSQTHIAQMIAPTIKMVFSRRVCFLVVYFSIVGWLVIQYGKRLGLSDIHRIYNY